VQVEACRVLANLNIEPQALVPVLSRVASAESVRVRVETAVSLGRVLAFDAQVRQSPELTTERRNEAFGVLCRLLKDHVSEVRAAAANALVAVADDLPAIDKLVAAAADQDRSVRLAIAQALLRRNGPGDPTAAHVLVGLVADPGPVTDRPQIASI